MKARIKIRQSNNNCFTLVNGKTWVVVHASEIKSGLLEKASKLKSIGCDYTANKIYQCIRLS